MGTVRSWWGSLYASKTWACMVLGLSVWVVMSDSLVKRF
jgi:hypothetical protein